MKTKEEHPDYDLDALRHLDLTPDQIKAHKTTRRFIHGLENFLVIGGIIGATATATGYGLYKYLPEPAKERIDDICSNLYSYLTLFSS